MIVQTPDYYSFLGNLKDVIIAGGKPITAKLKHNGEVIFTSNYRPNGMAVQFSLKDVIASRLKFNLPGSASVLENDMQEFEIETDAASRNFYVLPGGIAGSGTAETFVQTNFLTWQPQSKFTTWNVPNWLSYACIVENSRLRMKAYFADKTTQSITIQELAKHKIYTFDLTFCSIAVLFDKQPVYFDVFVEQAGKALTYVQRYVLTNRLGEHADYFVFENTLSGTDTILFTGEKSLISTAEARRAVFEEETFDYEIDFSNIYQKNTGYFENKTLQTWVSEFFVSSNRFHLVTDRDSTLKRITLSEPEMKVIAYQPNAFPFKFAYSKQEKYLNLPRIEELPEQLEIVVPDEPVFTLAPRLSELPMADVGADPIIPVQHPFENSWRQLRLSAILDSIKKVTIHGTPQFHYTNDFPPKVLPEAITLIAIEHNFEAKADERRWEYEFDGYWITLRDEKSNVLIITPDANYWHLNDSLTLRYTAQDRFSDTFTISKVRDGSNGQDGKEGEAGPSLAYAGKWSAAKQYAMQPKVRTVVLHEDMYYMTNKADPTTLIPIGTPPTDEQYWENYGATFTNIATNVLFAEDAYIAQLNSPAVWIGDKYKGWKIYDEQIESVQKINGFPKIRMTSNGDFESRGGSFKIIGSSGSQSLEDFTQGKADAAQSNAINTAAGNTSNQINSLKNGLGALAWQSKVEQAMLGTTIIAGGYIKAELLDIGAIKISGSFATSTDVKNAKNAAAADATSKANNALNSANTNTANQINTLKNSMGALAWQSKIEQAQLGTTIIVGGYIKTELINVGAIKISGSFATSNDVNNAKNAAATDATNKINNIQVGGVNLVQGSELLRVSGGKVLIEDAKSGEYYTISIQDSKIITTTSNQDAALVYTASMAGSEIYFGYLKLEQGYDSLTFKYPTNGTGKIYICGSRRWAGVVDYIKLKLEKGNKATDWSSATEDIEQYARDLSARKIRYIRDWLNGSTANANNHWVQIFAIDKSGSNIALNKTVTGPEKNPQFITNGNTNTSNFAEANGYGLRHAQVDLGQVYEIDRIQVWHYSADGRTYNATKTEVSSDGFNWFTIFDSAIEGKYKETSAGRTYYIKPYESAANQINTFKDGLGALAWQSKIEQAQLGTTIIVGGYIKTELINVGAIKISGNLATSTDVNNAKNAAAADATTKINNVQVGVINYLQGSRFDDITGWSTSQGNVSVYNDPNYGNVVRYERVSGADNYQKTFTVVDKASLTNTDLVFSVIAKRSSGKFSFGGWIQTANKLNSDTANKRDLGNGWCQYWVTFKSGNTIGDGVFGLNSITGAWLFYAAVILKGNKPTDWSLAPEDVAADAQKKADNALSTANSNTANQINTLKNSMGALAWQSKVEQAQLGTTIIVGGYIKTELINVGAIKISGSFASSTDVNNAKNAAINTAAADANNKIDNLQVGGRNYLRQAGYMISNYITNSVVLPAGDYIATCYNCKFDNIQINGIGYTFSNKFTLKEEKKVTLYALWGTNMPVPISQLRCKIEQGNKSTDWSLHDEDVAADAQNKANTAQNNAINTAAADATTKANNAQNNAINSANQTSLYLRQAFTNDTTITGGVIGTSLIKVGAVNSGGIWIEQAGINGTGIGPNAVRFYSGGTLAMAVNTINQTTSNKALYAVSAGGRLFAENAVISGRIESNKDGYRIVLDPDQRALQLVAPNNKTVVSIRQYESGTGGSISINDDLDNQVVLSSILYHMSDRLNNLFRIALYDSSPNGHYSGLFMGRASDLGLNDVGTRNIVHVNPYKGDLRVRLLSLPTNPAGLLKGDLWRNGNQVWII